MNLWRDSSTNRKPARRPKNLGIAIVGVGFALAFIGCGGSGGGGGFSTRATIRSSALATYQTVAALSAYPVEALEASAPAGSNITAPPSSAPSSTTLTLVHHTGLFTTGAQPTANGAIFKYFTDSTGVIPAGSMSLISSTGSFVYSKYPATVEIAINVTAGNLPCQGKAEITILGSSGASETTGILQLTKNHESVSFDLALSSDHQVTGSIQIVQNGITLSAKHLDGPLIGDQSMDFSISPAGFSGTGTVDLISPTITLLFSDPSGASASIDSLHHMVIHYPPHMDNGGDDDILTPIIEVLIGDGGGDSSSSDGSGSTTSTDTGTTDTGTTDTGTTDTGTTTSTTGSDTGTSTTDTGTTGGDGCYAKPGVAKTKAKPHN